MEIFANVDPPIPRAEGDRLVFKRASNGIYSVKVGYNSLKWTGSSVSIGNKELWSSVWHRGDVLPRIRVFLWKLLHRTLPLAKIMHRRFPAQSPICVVCGCQEEDVSHLLHFCPFSRACFLAGPLGLRTDEFQGEFTDVLHSISVRLEDEQWLLYVNSAWTLWRCRNDCTYYGKIPDFQLFLKYLNTINKESRNGASRKHCALMGRGPSSVSLTEVHNNYSCFSDGSWADGWHGGIDVVVWYKEELVIYESKGAKGCCPLQVEALALKEAVLIIIGLGVVACSFYTDCLELVNICSSQQPPINADWRAFENILEVWSLLQENISFVCVHVQINQNKMADNLAKQGRFYDWDCVEHTFSSFKQ